MACAVVVFAACMQARRILLRQGYRFATRLEANEVREWA